MSVEPETYARATADAPARRPDARPDATTRAFLAMIGEIACGRLTVELPSGARVHAAGAAPGPDATLVLHDTAALRRLFAGGKLGFAEAYLDGAWSSPDLAVLVELAARNERALACRLTLRAALALWHSLLNRARNLATRNTRRGARRNIAGHYDLGNGFYRQWLDPTMTYSAAIFATGRESLAEAQQAKWRRIAEIAELRPGQRVLEIGCGWGGFALWLARERGCHVTAITLSRAQYDWAARAVAAAGLAGRVEIRLQDYRDVDGTFDRIVSVEMLEAVGEDYWPAFFRVLRERLAPGGLAGLQVITVADASFDAYRSGADFIRRYIFPGGMLPSPRVLHELVTGAGLETLDDAGFAADYARTLAIWRARFEGAWPQIAPLGFDGRFRRMWRYYLAYSEGGFRAGTIDVRQIALRRPG